MTIRVRITGYVITVFSLALVLADSWNDFVTTLLIGAVVSPLVEVAVRKGWMPGDKVQD